VLFDRELDAAAEADRQLEIRLPGATRRGEIRVHYQPIVDLTSMETIAYEALARWDSPLTGMVRPAQFLRTACESGEIVEIGRWVLRDACARVKAAQRTRLTPGLLIVSVNVSAREFVSERYVEQVTEAIREFDIPPAALQLEITEEAFIGDVDGAIAKLRRLRRLGVRIALDDFGTGYSSLSYLSRLPLSVLKLDPTLVAHVANDRRARSVVAAVLQLASALDITVIAEGVETEEQARALVALGVQCAQGHRFGSPAPAELTGLGAPLEGLARAA
jgi:EAL domain-containing protein (putative c-di-GMP-specific phosphodiesterase class I)